MFLKSKHILFFSILLFSSCAGLKKTSSDSLGHPKKQQTDRHPVPVSIQSYIRQYQQICISEMHRKGIPASITMAQAILESGIGSSELAIEAHNHFGIKCGDTWKGRRYYKKDDDYHKGKLIASCFRAYASAASSFADHSDFISDPAKRSRYGFLFDIPLGDYKAWARGLQDAGYASSKSYAEQLIQLIERYSLDSLDRDQHVVPQSAPVIDPTRYYVVQSGDTLYMISKKFGISVQDIKKMNNLDSNEIHPGQKLRITN